MDPLTAWVLLGGFFLIFLLGIGQPVYMHEDPRPIACFRRGIKLVGKVTIFASLLVIVMWAASSI